MQTKLPKQQLEEMSKEIELVLGNKPCVAKKKSKTSTERVRAFRARKNGVPKTSAERARDYRARKKSLRQAYVDDTATLSSENTETQQDCLSLNIKSSTERVRQYRARKKLLRVIESFPLPKCLEVVSLVHKHENEAIAKKTNLSVAEVEQILKCMEHIETISKYVPNAIKFVMPDELNKIKAITEILREFISRLMQLNVKLTDEELMLNAKLLKNIFCVNGMQIDEKWIQFFRENFQQTNSTKKSIKNLCKTDFYIRNILNDIKHMFNSKVFVRFIKYLNTNSKDLMLISKEMIEKQETEAPQELSIKEEIEIGEYTISEITGEMLCEPREFCKNEENQSELIEIYAEIDDEDDVDGNLMNFDEQTETSLTSTNESTIKMDEHSCIKQEIENSEYTASETDALYSHEILIEQIKAEPIEIYSNQDIKEETIVLFSESQVVQSAVTQISVESSMQLDIKQEPSEPNSDNSDDNEICTNQTVPHTMKQICIEPVEHIVQPEPIKTLKTKVYQSVQNKKLKIKDAPNEADANDESMPYNQLIQFKYGDHLTEERALQIGSIFNLKPYGELTCEQLLLDPIICTYMHILFDQPLQFSETALRKSFQIVLGKELYNCPYYYYIQPKDLGLYRRCVLLVYSTKYKLLQLKDIMKLIFSEFEMKFIIKNSHHIIEEWRTFFNKHFITTLYTKAVYEIYFEYRTRYCFISAVLDKNTLNAVPETTTKDIQKFLRYNFKLEKHWQQGYKAYIKKKPNKSLKCGKVYTINDLSLNSIYEDIKELLPQLVVEAVNSDNSERHQQ